MDIVILGATLSWRNSQGQRGPQLAREFLRMGHRVLYVEAEPTHNQARYNGSNFKLINILPRYWPIYDPHPILSTPMGEKSAGRSLIDLLDGVTNSWLFRSMIRALPSRVAHTLVRSRVKHAVPLETDLPLIQSQLSIALDAFCLPKTTRIAIFETPMRCYTECLSILADRGFKIVYELIDKWELMPLGEKIRRPSDEEKLVRAADLVTATSKALLSELNLTYPWKTQKLYLPNAVSREIFDINLVKKIPNDMPRGKVTLGYFGSICEWFDFDVVNFVTTQKPEWEVVIIGEHPQRAEFPLQIWKRITSKPNVHALGWKPHTELIRYLAYWDVCIIPFIDNLLTRATSPVKIYEYLSAYKPVVMTKSDETKDFPYVHHARNKEDFVNKIEEALRTHINKRRIDTFLSENIWRKRSDKLLTILGTI